MGESMRNIENVTMKITKIDDKKKYIYLILLSSYFVY